MFWVVGAAHLNRYAGSQTGAWEREETSANFCLQKHSQKPNPKLTTG